MKTSFLISMLVVSASFFLGAEVTVAAQSVPTVVPLESLTRGAPLIAPAKQNAAKATGTKRALIVSSLPGDEEHLEQFKESITLIRTSLIEKFGFEEANVRIQFGRNEDNKAPSDWETVGRATKDELSEEAAGLVEKASESDTTWVFVIGHTYFDSKTVFFNVPDVDITHEEFGSAFEKLKGSSVFFICTPASGYFIKGLSQPNRVVITATEADWETNGSIFHTHLAKTMESILRTPEFDFDKDGKVTLLDLYIKTNRDLVDAYLVDGETPLFPTEHPNLDDNADGRGSELQIDYLTPEQGGQMGKKRHKEKHDDGALAGQTSLPFTLKQAEASLIK